MVTFEPFELEGNEITDKDLGRNSLKDEQLFSAQQFMTALDYLAEMVGGPEVAVAYAMSPARLAKLETAIKSMTYALPITSVDVDFPRLSRYQGIPIMPHPELPDNEVYCWRGRNQGKHWISRWVTEKY